MNTMAQNPESSTRPGFRPQVMRTDAPGLDKRLATFASDAEGWFDDTERVLREASSAFVVALGVCANYGDLDGKSVLKSREVSDASAAFMVAMAEVTHNLRCLRFDVNVLLGRPQDERDVDSAAEE